MGGINSPSYAEENLLIQNSKYLKSLNSININALLTDVNIEFKSEGQILFNDSDNQSDLGYYVENLGSSDIFFKILDPLEKEWNSFTVPVKSKKAFTAFYDLDRIPTGSYMVYVINHDHSKGKFRFAACTLN
ncbi:hypothetical protein [Metabacillus fastidiosus]|uniref:hypothetical protein n=1 Tax=Metabacillus fastidiosus TaxID=1458 RepID=UPI003D265BE7